MCSNEWQEFHSGKFCTRGLFQLLLSKMRYGFSLNLKKSPAMLCSREVNFNTGMSVNVYVVGFLYAFHLKNLLGTGNGSHLSQLEHRKMRKLMRKKVATVAKLPHRMTCTCPLLSMLPGGPMVGAGSGTSWWSPSVLQRWEHGRGVLRPPAERPVCFETTSHVKWESLVMSVCREEGFEQSQGGVWGRTGLTWTPVSGQVPSVVQAFCFPHLKTSSGNVQAPSTVFEVRDSLLFWYVWGQILKIFK